MKKSLDLSSIAKSITHFFGRYHALIFFILIGSLLAVGLLITISIVTATDSVSPEDTATTVQGFDENTIDRIDSLKNANDKLEPLPNGRVNPFYDE